MQFPYAVIDSILTARAQFDQTEGYQPTHSLFYLKKGNFVIELNGERQEVGEGDCFLLPDYIYFRRSVLAPIEFVYIKFAQNPACPYTFPIPFGKIRPQDKTRFLSNIDAILRCIGEEGVLAAAYREHLLLDILFSLRSEGGASEASQRTDASGDRLVAAATEYISANIGKKLPLGELCRAIGTNPSTLNYKFRREFGTSVGQFILSERIKCAKRLLVSTTYSVSQIALKCGFENVYYFSNTFKKHAGIFPSGYRA